MEIILVNKRHGGTTSFTLSLWMKIFLSLGFVVVPCIAVMAFLEFNKDEHSPGLLTPSTTKAWEDALEEQEQKVSDMRVDLQGKLAAMTLRVARLQARLVRLDALGERLTTIAKMDNGEFDFTQAPALGGPEQVLLPGEDFQAPSLTKSIDGLSDLIENRQHQLETLERLLANKKISDDVFIAGRPIKKGWMSSRFGRRNDPFTGRIAMHEGVDFAGKEGADIIAVAAGVVTASQEHKGYGHLVEINHGNGFVTRYAHCKEKLVKVGDVVKKGQVVALMGSTGRSTGPHVHFEVFKNGRVVDPATYIHRASR